MKNPKFYMKSLALIATSSISLLSGCSKENMEMQLENCEHLIIYFENESVTFKECDGYDVKVRFRQQAGSCVYEIYKNDKLLLEGRTMNYNSYNVDHDCADKELDITPIQKQRKNKKIQ